MPKVLNKGSRNDHGEPSKKRMRYSPQVLTDEIKKLHSKEIKSGLVHCNNAVISLDGQEFDLLNLSPDVASNLLKIESTPKPKKKKITSSSIIPKLIEKKLSSENNEFLNYLAQSITHENLGRNYQAVPFEFCVYQENDFRLPRENNQEKNPSHFLILVCPTNCKGGEINFPDFRQKLFGKANKSLSFALFGIKAQYEVMKVTEGLRVLVIYKIFENNLKMELKEQGVMDTEKLKEILKDIKDENVLIPITEDRIIERICKEAKIKHILVYSDDVNPDEVYDDIMMADMVFDKRYREVEFKDLVEEAGRYEVETFIDLQEPIVQETDSYSRWLGKNSSMSSSGQVEYFCFLLINPS